MRKRRAVGALVAGALLVTATLAACSSDSRGTATTPRKNASKVTPLTAPANSTRVELFADTALEPIVDRLAVAFRLDDPKLQVETTFAKGSDLLDQANNTNRPAIIFSTKNVVASISKPLLAAAPAQVGTDVMQLIVGKGNPKHITGLNVFGSSAGTTSGVCDSSLPCGQLAAKVLAAAKVAPAPDSTSIDPLSLVDQVKQNKLDAALVLRTDARLRFLGTSSVPIPAQFGQVVQYDVARTGKSAPNDEFVSWLLTARDAHKILVLRGLLAAYGAKL